MRLELTKKTDLAFKALATVASAENARVNGSILAEDLEISTQYLPHVMSPLTRAGWVESVSGPHGGYTLAVSLDDVTLLDLVVAVEGPVDETRCLHQGPLHDDSNLCKLHIPWNRARSALLDELAATSLSDMLATAAH